jgi:hypothetical protein
MDNEGFEIRYRCVVLDPNGDVRYTCREHLDPEMVKTDIPRTFFRLEKINQQTGDWEVWDKSNE